SDGIPACTRTRSSSHESIRETGESQGLVADSARVYLRGIFGRDSFDDRGQLLGAGCHLANTRGIRWHGVVQRRDARRGIAFGLVAPAGFLAGRAGHRDSAGRDAGLVHAGVRLEVIGRTGHGGAFAVDPLERRGHHLADLRTYRHWSYGPRPVYAGHR